MRHGQSGSAKGREALSYAKFRDVGKLGGTCGRGRGDVACGAGLLFGGFAADNMARGLGFGIASPELPMKFGSRIVLPYAISDAFSTTATVKTDQLLDMPRHSSTQTDQQ